MKGCCGETCWDEVFTDRRARKQLRRYREKGPRKSTRILIDRLTERKVEGLELLDIGGGIGAIQHEMLKAGIERVTNVEASRAFLTAMKEEAEAQGTLDKIDFHYGNFVDLAQQTPSADIVTLDLVICCFKDMDQLVGLSAEKARWLYGLVLPRRRLFLRILLPLVNGLLRLRGKEFRPYLHKTEDVITRVRSKGLKLIHQDKKAILSVMVFERAAAS